MSNYKVSISMLIGRCIREGIMEAEIKHEEYQVIIRKLPVADVLEADRIPDGAKWMYSIEIMIKKATKRDKHAYWVKKTISATDLSIDDEIRSYLEDI